MAKSKSSSFDRALLSVAIKDSFKKLHPRAEMRNPVMFVTWVGALVTSITFILALVGRHFSGLIFKLPSGFGSRFCSPTLLKLSQRGAARRRPKA
jgi:high-affinity K+ transport system ATPase subunit B